MKIISTNPVNFYPQTSFKSYSKLKFNGEIPIYTTTMFFRNDLDWNRFVFMVSKFYQNIPKVNVICHACSDGEEAFSLALKLKTKLFAGAEKFFPILARDVNMDNIKIGNRAKYRITKDELERMEENCGKDLYKYTDIIKNKSDIFTEMGGHLKEKVMFKKADILEDIQNIPHKNTILMCRNFWMYLKPDERITLADELSKRLDSSSLLILGNFDTNNGIQNILKLAGFEEFGLKGVYRKNPFLQNLLPEKREAILLQYTREMAARIKLFSK